MTAHKAKKYRIFVLAKEFGLASKEVVGILSGEGFPVKNHLCTVGEAARALLAVRPLSKNKTPLPPAAKNDLADYLTKCKVIMDSSSLCKQRKAYDFFLHAIEIISRTGSKILVPDREIREIAKRGRLGADRQFSLVLSVLPFLVRAGILEIYRQEAATGEEDTFSSIFDDFSQDSDILFITQNFGRAAKAKELFRHKRAGGCKLHVKRLSDRGELIKPAPGKKDKRLALREASPLKDVEQTSVGAAGQKARKIYCVPFYSEPPTHAAKPALKRLIADSQPTNYCVSQDGLVYKIGYLAKYNNCVEVLREVKQRIGGTGYKFVPVKLPGAHFIISVHRLVALAFCDIGDWKNDTVDHIDGNRLNNRHTNLEWVEREENQRRALLMQEKKENGDRREGN